MQGGQRETGVDGSAVQSGVVSASPRRRERANDDGGYTCRRLCGRLSPALKPVPTVLISFGKTVGR